MYPYQNTDEVLKAINTLGKPYFNTDEIELLISTITGKIDGYYSFYIARTQEKNTIKLEVSILLDKVVYDFTLKLGTVTITTVFMKYINSIVETYSSNNAILKVEFLVGMVPHLHYNISGADAVATLAAYIKSVNTKIQTI